MNSQLQEFFKTTVGICQRCLLSSILLSLFLKKITQETLHDHHTSISTPGRPIGNPQFTNGIDLTGSHNAELQDLTNRLVDKARAPGMEISARTSKIMTNSTNKISADISMNERKLEVVTSFKHLGAAQCKDGTSSAEIQIKIASALAALASLNRIWQSNTSRVTPSASQASPVCTVEVLPPSPSSSTTVKHGPCLLMLKKKDLGLWNQVPEETSLHFLLGAQDE